MAGLVNDSRDLPRDWHQLWPHCMILWI